MEKTSPEWFAADSADALTSSIRQLKLPPATADLRLFEFPHDAIREHERSLRENLEYRLRDGYHQQSDGLFVAEGVTIGSHLVTDTKSRPDSLGRRPDRSGLSAI